MAYKINWGDVQQSEGQMRLQDSATALRDPADRRRYRAAERLLQSPAWMVEIERTVAAFDLAGPPAAHCLAGRTRLQRARRIGLFSGSFNPLTDAHIIVADAARAQAGLDALVWAEALVTVDKERVTRASLPDRLAQLVACARPRGEAVALLNRGLYADQAQALRAATRHDARIFVVVGFDKVVQIFDPHYYADREAALAALFTAAELLVAPRARAGAPQLAALLAKPENRAYAERVTPLAVRHERPYDSATLVRRLAADPTSHQHKLERLVPPEGLALIATGAYAATETYALRQAWLAVLAAAPRDILPRLPPLARLVERASGHAERRALLDAQAHPTQGVALALLRQVGALPANDG